MKRLTGLVSGETLKAFESIRGLMSREEGREVSIGEVLHTLIRDKANELEIECPWSYDN